MIAEMLLGAVCLTAYLLGCMGTGAALVQMLPGRGGVLKEVSPYARVATTFILGQGVLSQLLVLAGLVLEFTPTLVLSLVILAVLLGGRAVVADMRAAMAKVRTTFLFWRRERVIWQALGLGTAVLAGLLGILNLVSPPIGDAEAFYFIYGKFLAAGRQLSPLTGVYEPFSSIGLVGEIHFGALMALAGPRTAKLFVWFIACAACLMLAEIGRLCGMGQRGRLITIILVLTSSTVVYYIPDGKVDLFAAALGLAAYFWAIVPETQQSRTAAPIIAGVLGGLACVAKVSYIPVLPPGLLAIFLLKPRLATEARARARAIAILAMAAAFAALPHLIKNAVFFGEPLAPFGAWWLNQTWFGPEETAWIIKTYPLALVFGQYPLQGGTLSYPWLALLPLALFLPRAEWQPSSPLAMATLAGALGLVIWVVMRPSIIAPRYILATLLLLFLPAARGAEVVAVGRDAPRVLTIATILSLVVALAVVIAPYRTLPREVIRLARGRLPLCHRATVYCTELETVNGLTAPGDRIYLDGYYSYWLRPDLLICRNSAREIGTANAVASDQLWRSIFDAGFKFAVIDRTSHARGLARFVAASPPAWLDVTEVFLGDRLVVFRVMTRDASRRPTARCVSRPGGGWQVVRNGG